MSWNWSSSPSRALGGGRRDPAGCVSGSSAPFSPRSQEPRAGATVSAGLGGRQGWAREPKACRAGPAPHCGWVVAGPFPAGARSLAFILPASPPRSAMQLRGWLLRPELGLAGLGAEDRVGPGRESGLGCKRELVPGFECWG